jgi:uncharacterized heparinase superfamily protein
VKVEGAGDPLRHRVTNGGADRLRTRHDARANGYELELGLRHDRFLWVKVIQQIEGQKETQQKARKDDREAKDSAGKVNMQRTFK